MLVSSREFVRPCVPLYKYYNVWQEQRRREQRIVNSAWGIGTREQEEHLCRENTYTSGATESEGFGVEDIEAMRSSNGKTAGFDNGIFGDNRMDLENSNGFHRRQETLAAMQPANKKKSRARGPLEYLAEDQRASTCNHDTEHMY